ncbi:cupin domain-containing protein [Streptomyces violascens]|uniref:cupin domain-containing protein n=1 Tax=Streptomyces violascens TaxID=67381 RepID=UPI003683E297
MQPTKRFTGVIAVTVASLALTVGTAQATPSRGVTATIISKETSSTAEIVRAEITIQPGGSTGWHYHDGQVSGTVKEGTLSHFNSTCASDGTYHAGDRITEDSGPGYMHIGQNRGTTPVVLDVTYINPIGKPLSEDVPNPGCSFQ